MWSLLAGGLLTFLKRPGLMLTVLIVACVVSFWAGLSVRGWFIHKQEITAYKEQIERERKQAAKDLEIVAEQHQKALDTEKRRFKQTEVIQYVKIDADCNYDPNVGLRLDAAAGVPGAAERIAEPDAFPPVDLDLSQRQVIYWCSDMASLYDECRGRLDALIQWHQR